MKTHKITIVKGERFEKTQINALKYLLKIAKKKVDSGEYSEDKAIS